MTDAVVGGRTDNTRGGDRPGIGPHGSDPHRVALAVASGLLSDPPALPVRELLSLARIGRANVGVSVDIEGAEGPVRIASAGDVDLPVVRSAPIAPGGRTIGAVHRHGVVGTDGSAAIDRVGIDLTAIDLTDFDDPSERLARLVTNLLEAAPPWGLLPHDPVGALVVGHDGSVASATPSIAAALGTTTETLVGRPVLELLHPDDREVALLAFSRTRETSGRRLPREWRVRCDDGTARTVHVTGDNRLDDPSVRGVVYGIRTMEARSSVDRLLGAHMRVLEDIAKGLPICAVLARITELLDRFVDGHALLFTIVETPGPRDDSGERQATQVLVLDDAPHLPPSLAARLAAAQPVTADGPPWAQAALRGESALDLHLAGPAFAGWREELHTLGIRSTYAHPFRTEQADRLGVVAVLSRRDGAPSDEEAHVLKVAAGLARLAMERDLDAAELRRRATHDDLTGLANRALLVDLLDHVLANLAPDRLAALVFIDIDRFKLVNDSYGHGVGDDLLRSVGARLWATAPPGATIARFGADEFVALLPTLAGPHEALAAADAFNMAMQAPFVLGGAELRATVSMGVAFAHSPAPGTPTDAALLLRDADVAVSRAKSQGRDRIEIFDDVLRETARVRLRMEQDLRQALVDDQLLVHYQPEIDLHSGMAVGVEALVRWEHPEHGMLFPSAFIELAEETGLVVPLGARVLAHAAAQAARWQVDGTPPFTVWVNAAMRQLDPASRLAVPLIHTIGDLLTTWKLPPHTLGVEITERDLVRDLDDTIGQLTELADLGVRLAVDDFGTGYASLTYLKRLPVHVVKIDQSFVAGLGSDPQDDAIVGAVIQLASALGKDVVAEGVETPRQRDRLLALGCRFAQGYLLGRPAPATDLVR